MGTMWTPWVRVTRWAHASNESALGNARAASTELSRSRVEREEIEVFLRGHASRHRRVSTVRIGTTRRPA